MIKKIICPIDFSKAAINASEYAAKLAQVFNAELSLVNVQQIMPVAAAVSMDAGIGANEREYSRMASDRLKKMSTEINKMFKISTEFEVDVTVQSLEKIFSSIEGNNTMIVMGTNGVDDMYQYFFGTNTYHVIKKANCPVFVVPENASYGTIKKIVFAWDYTHKNKFSFSLLNEFMKVFNPQFVFLHSSKHSSDVSREIFKALRAEVESVLGEDNNNVEFVQVFSDDVPESINKYMIESNADLLSITFYNRGLIKDIFHGTVAKKLTETAAYPILILHA